MEKDFAKLDPNYKNASAGTGDFVFQNAFEGPFVLEGHVFRNPDGTYGRIPMSAAEKCMSSNMKPMSLQGAGELLRFRTDSPKITMRAKMSEVWSSSIRSGSCGFDLYTGTGPDSKFKGLRVIPPGTDLFEASWETGESGKMHDVALYFPYHSTAAELEIGLERGCSAEAPAPHRMKGPVVFYGSSITGCSHVERPGLLYTAQIGRMLDVHVVNMGFGGNCKGELPIADAIATLDLSMLVLEYDWNAPDAEFLQNTHEKFFRYFRTLKPDTPVLMMSKCDFRPGDEVRRAVVFHTFIHAWDSGDRKVDFLDGETLLAGFDREDCTADCCHPNSLGARRMAERIACRMLSLLSRC